MNNIRVSLYMAGSEHYSFTCAKFSVMTNLDGSKIMYVKFDYENPFNKSYSAPKAIEDFFNYAKLENFPFNYGKYANNGVYIMHIENYNLTVN